MAGGFLVIIESEQSAASGTTGRGTLQLCRGQGGTEKSNQSALLYDFSLMAKDKIRQSGVRLIELAAISSSLSDEEPAGHPAEKKGIRRAALGATASRICLQGAGHPLRPILGQAIARRVYF